MQVLTAETFKVWKFRTIYLPLLDQYASRWRLSDEFAGAMLPIPHLVPPLLKVKATLAGDSPSIEKQSCSGTFRTEKRISRRTWRRNPLVLFPWRMIDDDDGSFRKDAYVTSRQTRQLGRISPLLFDTYSHHLKLGNSQSRFLRIRYLGRAFVKTPQNRYRECRISHQQIHLIFAVINRHIQGHWSLVTSLYVKNPYFTMRASEAAKQGNVLVVSLHACVGVSVCPRKIN